MRLREPRRDAVLRRHEELVEERHDDEAGDEARVRERQERERAVRQGGERAEDEEVPAIAEAKRGPAIADEAEDEADVERQRDERVGEGDLLGAELERVLEEEVERRRRRAERRLAEGEEDVEQDDVDRDR